MLLFNSVDLFAICGLILQNKLQGVKIKQDVILYDDPSWFRLVLVIFILSFYAVSLFFSFQLYKEIKQSTYDYFQNPSNEDEEDRLINDSDDDGSQEVVSQRRRSHRNSRSNSQRYAYFQTHFRDIKDFKLYNFFHLGATDFKEKEFELAVSQYSHNINNM